MAPLSPELHSTCQTLLTERGILGHFHPTSPYIFLTVKGSEVQRFSLATSLLIFSDRCFLLFNPKISFNFYKTTKTIANPLLSQIWVGSKRESGLSMQKGRVRQPQVGEGVCSRGAQGPSCWWGWREQ